MDCRLPYHAGSLPSLWRDAAGAGNALLLYAGMDFHKCGTHMSGAMAIAVIINQTSLYQMLPDNVPTGSLDYNRQIAHSLLQP